MLDGLFALWDLNLEGQSDLKGGLLLWSAAVMAIDVARCALCWCGTGLNVLSPYSSENMALPEEIKAALNEGVKIDFLVNPIRVIAENDRLKVECIRME